MNEKHAYMIMAHDNFDVLIEILKELDNERNDIFLHIDKKTKDFPEEELKNAVLKGRIFFIPRMDVSWGGYSQIACELSLMQNAVKHGRHEYYHMFTGATFPLKDSEEILSFFDQHKGYEFIGYDNSDDYSGRVKKYNIFNETGKATTKIEQLKAFCRNKFRGLQGRINFVYKPARGIKFKKGFVYWSLTEDAVKYALEQYPWIKRVFKHSFCGDELFMQTIIYNSKYKTLIYNYENEYEGCMRYVKPVRSWEENFSGASIDQVKEKENSITKYDIDKCLESNKLFGLKFVGEEGLSAIKEIRKRRENVGSCN